MIDLEAFEDRLREMRIEIGKLRANPHTPDQAARIEILERDCAKLQCEIEAAETMDLRP